MDVQPIFYLPRIPFATHSASCGSSILIWGLINSIQKWMSATYEAAPQYTRCGSTLQAPHESSCNNNNQISLPRTVEQPQRTVEIPRIIHVLTQGSRKAVTFESKKSRGASSCPPAFQNVTSKRYGVKLTRTLWRSLHRSLRRCPKRETSLPTSSLINHLSSSAPGQKKTWPACSCLRRKPWNVISVIDRWTFHQRAQIGEGRQKVDLLRLGHANIGKAWNIVKPMKGFP